VKTTVIVKGGVFNGAFSAGFMTSDFEFFKQQLKKLDNDFNGSAKFEPLEGQLILSIKGDGFGISSLTVRQATVAGFILLVLVLQTARAFTAEYIKE
jgi:hypothetical protein